MPCKSDYMEPNHKEKYLSQVACLLDELNGKKIKAASWMKGYHPKIYNQFVKPKDADNLVSELCERLQKVDITKYSLEMQIWWRDHQAADKKRIENQLKKETENKIKAKIIEKLTPYERKLLKV